jgi:hypothetical protein
MNGLNTAFDAELNVKIIGMNPSKNALQALLEATN